MLTSNEINHSIILPSLLPLPPTPSPNPPLVSEFQRMHKSLFATLLLASLILIEVTCQESMLAPPDRPDEFRSPGELRRYLKALNEYYAIVGRPR